MAIAIFMTFPGFPWAWEPISILLFLRPFSASAFRTFAVGCFHKRAHETYPMLSGESSIWRVISNQSFEPWSSAGKGNEEEEQDEDEEDKINATKHSNYITNWASTA